MTSHFKPHVNINLYRGFQGSSTYVWSPFVTKLEARLRFGGLSYRNEAGSPFSGPRGKIPYVTISKPDPASPPTTMGDSTLIVRKLVEDGLIEDLNGKLDPVDKARDLALRALLEDKLYWYQVGRLRKQLRKTDRPLTCPSYHLSGLRKMARELLHYAPARAPSTAVPYPIRRWPAGLSRKHEATLWAGNRAILCGGDRFISAGGLGELRRASHYF